jgi:multicomponent Na+:H+ antiporter subunit D
VAPLPVSALFAGLLTKVGVYALFRVVPMLGEAPVPLTAILLPIAVATMVIGVIGALGRATVREILSFHIVSQVGYMVLGLALGTRAALAAGVFYLVHHIVVKTALFLAGGVVERSGGGSLGAVAGLAHARPWLGVAFLLPALALAGLPPLSGFWGKLFLVLAGFQASAWIATAAAIAVSLLTLASMLKIWNAAFWGEATPGAAAPTARPMLAAALVLAALSLAIGLCAPPLLAHCERIAEQLGTGTAYRSAVLGGTTP